MNTTIAMIVLIFFVIVAGFMIDWLFDLFDGVEW